MKTISKGFISIIRMEDVSKNFFAHYQKIDELDGFIGTGDKMARAEMSQWRRGSYKAPVLNMN